MLRPAIRQSSQLMTRRGGGQVRNASFYHYPEGPGSNLPFNRKSKWFGVGYWGFMATGFSIPFALAVWQTKKNKS